MSNTFTQFEKRLASLERKHKELAHGYVPKINPDGLITIEPRRVNGRIGARVLVAGVLGFMVFKIATVVLVGSAVYEERLDAMRNGTGAERFGAWILQNDPVTEAVSGVVLDLMR